MLTIILSLLAIGLIGCFITWGVIACLGRSQSLSVQSIENPNSDLYLAHLKKPENMTWKAGSSAKVVLPDIKESGQKSRRLTIASNSNDNEILILMHNSGSLYKKTFTGLPAGETVEMSWLNSNLSVTDGKEPLVCFASGVGIAAIRPIIKAWIGKRHIILSHLDKDVVVFDKELSQMAQKDGKLNYIRSPRLSQSKDKLAKSAERYGNNAIYLLSGQPDDVEAMKKFLADKGVDSEQIKAEKFKGLK